MPCQHCKSTGHTLSQCGVDINVYLGPIKEMIETRPFALRHQFQALNAYTKPVLMLINMRLGYLSARPKAQLIDNIIHHYFIPRLQIDPAFLPLGPDVREAIVEAFQNLQMWNIDNKPDLRNFRRGAFDLLDIFHRAAFRISYTESLQAAALAQGMIRLQQLIQPQPQNHLKKLNFRLKTDNSLAEAKECFMCCEERPHAKLGCSHEYCIDCLFGTAKVRTKSFISCAVCRAEINEVQVGNADTKLSLLRRISEV